MQSNSGSLTLDAPALTALGGDVVIQGNSGFVALFAEALPSGGLQTFGGNQGGGDVRLGYTTLDGAVRLASCNDFVVTMPQLTAAGTVAFSGSGGTSTTLVAPRLATLTDDLSITSASGPHALDLPALTTIGDDLYLAGNGAAVVVTLGALTSVGDTLTVNNNPHVELSATALDAVGDVANFTDNDGGFVHLGITSMGSGTTIAIYSGGDFELRLPNLEVALSSLYVQGNVGPIALHAPLITSAGFMFVNSNTAGVTLDLAGLTAVGTHLYVDDNPALVAAAIDLGALDAVPGELTVTDNPALSACWVEALHDGLSTQPDPGNVTISGNLDDTPCQ